MDEDESARQIPDKDTAPYDEVAQGQRNDDLEAQAARELAAREAEADELAESLRQELRREERHGQDNQQISSSQSDH